MSRTSPFSPTGWSSRRSFTPRASDTGHLAAVAAAGHVALLAAFIAPTGPLSLQGFLTVTGIPLLLFAWIGHTARAIKPTAAGTAAAASTRL